MSRRFPYAGAGKYAPAIGVAPFAWWRADLGVTQIANVVSGWADQAGNGNNWSFAVGHTATLVASGINGVPTISGDGTATSGTSPTLSAAPATIIIVAQLNVTQAANQILITDSTTGNYAFYNTNSTHTSAAAVQTKSVVNNATLAHIYTITTGASGAFYVDGVKNAQSFTADTAQARVIFGGFSEWWGGYMSEGFMFSTALSDANLNTIHSYLGTRYGISVTLN